MAYNLKNEKNENVLREGKEILVSDFVGMVKSVDLEKRRLKIIGSDETVDRDGDIIEVKGWDLDNFLNNPVFLWAHDYSSIPIAAAEKVIRRKNPPRLEFIERFPSAGLYPFADMILELYAEKIVNACSVGFIAKKWEDIDGDPAPGQWRKGRKFKEQELLELSGCAVPANPNALQNALKGKTFAGVPAMDMIKWFENKGIPKPEKYADILEELFKGSTVIDESKKSKVQVPRNYKTICTVEEEKDEDIPEIKEEDFITNEEGLKPYPNEHACRLKTPDQYDRFARKNCYRKHDDKCVDYIFGIKENKTEVQALRFKKAIWTARAAEAVCDKHDGIFEAAGSSSEEDQPKEIPYKEIMEAVVAPILSEIKLTKEGVENILESVKGLKELFKGQELIVGHVEQTNDLGRKVKAAEMILEEGFSAKKPSTPPSQDKSSIEGVDELTKELKNLASLIKTLGGR